MAEKRTRPTAKPTRRKINVPDAPEPPPPPPPPFALPSDPSQWPIAMRAPPEVLVSCFTYLTASRGETSTHTRDCFTFSHVCRHWRAAALGAPLLWTRVLIGRSQTCVKAMLERSRGLPLDIEMVALSENHDDTIIAPVLDQLHRTCRLVVIGSRLTPYMNTRDEAPTWVHLAYRAGHWETHLESPPMSNLSSAASSAMTFPLLKLRTELQAKIMNMDILPHLRSCVLDTGSETFVYDFLQKSPRINHLTLYNYDQISWRISDGAKVSLPHLVALELVGTTEWWRALLEKLDVPQGLRLRLVDTSRWRQHGTMDFLLNVMNAHHGQMRAVKFELYLSSVAFCGWNDTDVSSPPAVHIAVADDMNHGNGHSVFTTFLQFNFDAIQVLKLVWPNLEHLEPTKIDELSTLPQMHTLSLEGSGVGDLVFWFANHMKRKERSSFPALRHLSLKGINMLRRHYSGRKNIGVLLMDALEERSGPDLESLTVRCAAPHAWRNRMSKLVDVLVIIDNC